MCDPGIRSRKLSKRDNIYNLLIPGIRESQSRRLVNYTDEEIEAVVDAYMAVSQATGSFPSDCISAAIRKLRELEALPLVCQRKAAHLSTLKSVSQAYRRSAIPGHFRPKERTKHVSRQSPQKADGNPPQASDPADAGDGAFVAYGNYLPGNYVTSYVGGNLHLVQANPYLAQANAGGLMNVPHGMTPLQMANMTLNRVAQMGQVEWLDHSKLPTEIKPGEIIAWRAWHVVADRLHSVTANAVWDPGVPMQGDVKRNGVHACKTRAKAESIAGMYDVVGEVELWGQVVEHEDGYRAEYGAIKSIHRRHGSSLSKKNLNDLRVAYGLAEAPAATINDDPIEMLVVCMGVALPAVLGLLTNSIWWGVAAFVAAIASAFYFASR